MFEKLKLLFGRKYIVKIDLGDMTDEKLDKLVKIASIAKISAEIEAMKN